MTKYGNVLLAIMFRSLAPGDNPKNIHTGQKMKWLRGILLTQFIGRVGGIKEPSELTSPSQLAPGSPNSHMGHFKSAHVVVFQKSVSVVLSKRSIALWRYLDAHHPVNHFLSKSLVLSQKDSRHSGTITI